MDPFLVTSDDYESVNRYYIVQSKAGEFFILIESDMQQLKLVFQSTLKVPMGFMKISWNNYVLDLDSETEFIPTLRVFSKINELVALIPNEEIDCLDCYRCNSTELVYQKSLSIKQKSDLKPLFACNSTCSQVIFDEKQYLFIIIARENGVANFALAEEDEEADSKYKIIKTSSARFIEEQVFVFDSKLAKSLTNPREIDFFIAANVTTLIIQSFDIANFKPTNLRKVEVGNKIKPGISNLVMRESAKYVFLATNDYKVKLLSLKKEKVIASIQLHEKLVNQISLLKRGEFEEKTPEEFIVSISEDFNLNLFDLKILMK